VLLSCQERVQRVQDQTGHLERDAHNIATTLMTVESQMQDLGDQAAAGHAQTSNLTQQVGAVDATVTTILQQNIAMSAAADRRSQNMETHLGRMESQLSTSAAAGVSSSTALQAQLLRIEDLTSTHTAAADVSCRNMEAQLNRIEGQLHLMSLRKGSEASNDDIQQCLARLGMLRARQAAIIRDREAKGIISDLKVFADAIQHELESTDSITTVETSMHGASTNPRPMSQDMDDLNSLILPARAVSINGACKAQSLLNDDTQLTFR
jgi:chromosome segregation ATPase